VVRHNLIALTHAVAPSRDSPVVLADAGVENVNAQAEALIETGVLRRLMAFTELKFSNSMIEAWTEYDIRVAVPEQPPRLSDEKSPRNVHDVRADSNARRRGDREHEIVAALNPVTWMVQVRPH